MKAEILAGMDLLDQKYPGWVKKVDLDRLDQWESEWTQVDNLTESCGCVLVQVFGSYITGLEKLGLFHGRYSIQQEEGSAEQFGFQTHNQWDNNGSLLGYEDEENELCYKTLTSWWKRLFRARYGGF